jgi:hypothetical protein
MRAACLSVASLLTLTLSGCGDSVSAHAGIGEPLRVTNGTYFEGSFPVSHDGGPDVLAVNIRNSEFTAGTAGKGISGLADSKAQSVALGLQGLGHGYWILPMGAPDQMTLGAFNWSANCDFSRDIPAGMQTLNIAAADANGQFGAVRTQGLNIQPFIPAGHVVASLSWGADADLDLHLVGPSGKELDPKHPNSAELYDAGDDAGLPMPGSGLLEHDSLAACVPDGMRTENVVWNGDPEPGSYLVRVDMFSACGKPAANFVFTLYVDGQRVLQKNGRLLDSDADGGGPGSGLFVTQFTCEGSGTCS